MRICAVTSFPPTIAGVADYGAFLVEEFSRDPRVDHVTVLADRVGGAPDHERCGRVEVRRVWERGRANIGIALACAIARARADVVWFNLGLSMFGTRPLAASAMIAPLIARASGYRTVVTLHELPALADLVTLGLDRPYGRLAGSLLVRLVLGASVVVVTLDRYRSYLTANHGARNVLHIPHGAWNDELTRAEEPDPETALVFGTFGPHKDPGFVAEAVSQLRRERPRLRLVVAGADHTRYPGFLAACRDRQRLDADWIGYVARDELPSLFARATVVVVPSHAATGASGVIHRAIGHGRALVVSDLPDHRALASEQDFGFAWFSPGSADDLGRALGALLQDRPLRNAQVAHNLHSLASRLPSRTAAAYLAVFAGRDLARDDAAA